MKKMNVLVACEESGTVCAAFRARGHNAFSCDIINTSGSLPQYHIIADCRLLLEGNVAFRVATGKEYYIYKWDIIIAFPPCTYTSNAGARHLWAGGKLNIARYYKGLNGKALFLKIINCGCPKICVENPLPSKVFGFPKPTQIIQPFMFGHPVSKRTCLWLKNLPPLVPTRIVEATSSCHDSHTWFTKGGKDRQRRRAVTFTGIAEAMAEQWGGEVNV